MRKASAFGRSTDFAGTPHPIVIAHPGPATKRFILDAGATHMSWDSRLRIRAPARRDWYYVESEFYRHRGWATSCCGIMDHHESRDAFDPDSPRHASHQIKATALGARAVKQRPLSRL